MPIKVFSSARVDRWWRSLLSEWAGLVDSYCRYFKDVHKNGEAPYWHGERATLGLLCAAAWRTAQGWSLMEYSARRRSSEENTSGKGDACVGVRGGRSWNLECKICWGSRYEDREESIQGVLDKLKAAKKQLGSINRDYREDEGLAVCFLVPTYRERGVAVEQMTEMFEILKKRSAGRNALVALYRPPEGKVLIDYRNRYSPGLLLLAESVSFPSRGVHK